MSQDNSIVYRPDVDGLRAVAVLAVLGFHAFPAVARGGFVGVDIFFVISGFLISSFIFKSLRDGRFTFAGFYARRIRRIFPALIVVLMFCLGYGWFALLGDEYKQLGKQVAGGAAFIPNLLFWRDTNYFDTSAELKPLLHLWSLGIEEQFYFGWPLLLVVAFRRRINQLWLTLLIIAGSFATNVVLIAEHPVAAYYLPLARFWELLVGAALAYTQNRGSNVAGLESAPVSPVKPALRNGVAAVGALLLVAAVFGLSKDRAFPGWWALAPAIGTLAIIAAGPGAWFNRRILARREVVFVGLISYPLYLWHWPLLSFARIVGAATPSVATRLMLLAASFILAALTYKFVEIPIRHGVKGASWNGVRVPVLGGLMSTLAALGLAVYQYDGLNGRFPAAVQYLTSYPYKYDNDYQHGVAYRYKQCMLDPAQLPAELDSQCTDSGFREAPVSMLLWGDSHAAALYPGLRSYQDQYGFKLAQMTTAGCAPLLNARAGTVSSHCAEKYQFALDLAHELSPSVVLLAARWDEYDFQRIAATVDALRKSGARRIVVLGPLPHWNGGLPSALYRFYSRHHSVPDRMQFGLEEDMLQVDERLRRYSQQAGADYISALRYLCNIDGCLTRVGDAPEDLTAFDYGHLTIAGSRLLVGDLLPALLEQPGLQTGNLSTSNPPKALN
jgi:peptidoglycan/LPS O-acetylase OafA/YrhL